MADIIKYAVENGGNETALNQRFGIETDQNIDPREHVSYEKMEEALTVVGQMSNDKNLGLHLGEQLVLKGTNQVDAIMQNSPTIEEAFSNAVVYGRLISDALTSKMVRSEHYTKVYFKINPNWSIHQNQAVQHIIDMTLVCTLKSIYWLTNAQFTPVEVHFNYPPKKSKREYYRIFNSPLKFNEESPSIIFNNPVLEQSVASPNSDLLEYLKQIANEELLGIQAEDALIISIKQSIINKLPQRTSFAELASELLISSRTLQRKLHKLDTNFKALESEIILKLAKKLIASEHRSIEEASYLLGFSEASSFIRFFKKKENLTPYKYRLLK